MNATRRDLLTATTGLIAASAVANIITDVPTAKAQGVHIRRDVATMTATDDTIVAYKDAITKMHSMWPDTDKRSWEGQAHIHQDYCPHSNWFFLPWHRAYLYYFEQLIRELSGYEEFALPYWNWTTDTQIPPTFWGADNPLDPAKWDDPDPNIGSGPTRLATQMTTMPATAVAQSVIDDILSETDFQQFGSYKASSQRPVTAPFGSSGELEQTPHNAVHGEIGGHMGFFLSPLDPIFWMHHGNIDRLWAKWNSLGNANSDDPDWLNYNFDDNFVDPAGSLQSKTVAETLDTEQLGYIYDNVGTTPAGLVASKPPSALIAQATAKFSAANIIDTEVNSVTTLPVTVSATPAIPADIKTLDRNLLTAGGRRVLAILSDITPPVDDIDIRVRVFINCSYLTPQTSTNDPHYVTTLAFFVSRHQMGGESMIRKIAFSVDLTETLTRLNRLNLNPAGVIDVQLVSVVTEGRNPDDAAFRVGNVEIVYA